MYKHGNIVLRSFEESHLEKTLQLVNDPDIATQINRVSPVTYTNHIKWYQNIINDCTKTIFAIETVDSKEHIGNCALIDIDHKNQKAELWIYLDKSIQGKGYGADAINGLLGYAFGKLNLNRVYLYVMDYNNNAINFYIKLGFKKEGLFRENMFMDGKLHDTVHMAILRREFKYTNGEN